MGRNVDDVIKGLPKERRARIAKASRRMAKEMIAYADSLAEVRKAFRKTQVDVGKGMSLAQNAISQLEARKDIRISTLAKYVGALGGELDLVIRSKDGGEVVYRPSVGPEKRARDRKPIRLSKR
ncbi:MAG TPA: helix-turn-helix transcriptional regulator [Usitatibacter sp.]|nr:helix-turn-helix transcriptional regulator [Usitatibacter sp.]